jgi:hypothetical protein
VFLGFDDEAFEYINAVKIVSAFDLTGGVSGTYTLLRPMPRRDGRRPAMSCKRSTCDRIDSAAA